MEDEKEKIKSSQNEKKLSELKKYRILFVILLIAYFLFYLINLVLIFNGVIYDGQEISLYKI